MTKRSKTLNYEWMVKYTPQAGWIEGKGLYLWLAFFFTEIFAGVYFLSLFLNFRAGLFTGWLGALCLGGFFHMLYLGRADRGWRILFKFSTSELSRGLWTIALFAAVGFLQLVPILLSGLPWVWHSSILKVLMGILCILVMIHGFMTMSVVKALPMWNSPMMIPLSLASGIWVGSQIVVIFLQGLGLDVALTEVWIRWAMFSYMAALLIYIWGNVHSSETARASVMRMIAGDCSAIFYIGAILLGIIIPLIITLALWGQDLSTISGGYFFLRFVCVMVGDAAMRYCIQKAPLYTPLI